MKQFELNGMELTVSKKERHEGKQPSKWDEVRHHLVDEDGNPKKDEKIEGFKTSGDAGACASRMRKAWGLQVKSYQNIKTGKFGICFRDEEEEGELSTISEDEVNENSRGEDAE